MISYSRSRTFLQLACTLFLLIGVFLPASADSTVEYEDACTAGSLPLRWIRSIEDQDWNAMASLLDTGASYVDPTMAHFNREPVELIGRKSIVDFWRTSSQESSSQDIRYELKRCFTSGGLAVLTLELSISVSGALWNVAKDRIDLHGYQTMASP